MMIPRVRRKNSPVAENTLRETVRVAVSVCQVALSKPGQSDSGIGPHGRIAIIFTIILRHFAFREWILYVC
jgi:hypothetical protein